MPEEDAPAARCRRQERVFIVRLWREAGEDASRGVRGSALEIGNGTRFLFSNLADLVDFLALRLGSLDGAPPAF